MIGQYQHAIDVKGRVFIPAKFREELGDAFYITVSADPCLRIYSQENWERFTERFDSLPYSRSKPMRPVLANAVRCEPDSQGRVVLPQKLRGYAALEKEAVIVGISKFAEIWDVSRWAEQEAKEMNPENLAAVTENLEF